MLAWILCCYGLVLVITSSTMTLGFRKWAAERSEFWGHGLECPMCVGFWAGFLTGSIGLRIVQLPAFTVSGVALGDVAAVVLNGFASSAACWVMHVVLARLGAEDL